MEHRKKVVFCTPFLSRPTPPFIASMEASLPLIEAAGWEHGMAQELGNIYISVARSFLLAKALRAEPDVIVFMDYDLSWDARDLLTLIDTDGEVVAGTYRYKKDEEEYMGEWFTDANGVPITRPDGCIAGSKVPAGFLKITPKTVERFMEAYPDLIYGKPWAYHVDLFHHGAHKRIWYSEDYAFSRNWRDLGGNIWIVPNLNLTHHNHGDGDRAYPGNLHEYLLRQPGGSKSDVPAPTQLRSVA